MKTSRLLALAALLFVAGCSKGPDGVSGPYQQARTLWLEVLVEKRADAYSDPRLNRVLELLQQVDPHGADAALARNLEAELERGLADRRAEEARLQEVVEQARRAIDPPRSETDALSPPAEMEIAGATATPLEGSLRAPGGVAQARDSMASEQQEALQEAAEREEGRRRLQEMFRQDELERQQRLEARDAKWRAEEQARQAEQRMRVEAEAAARVQAEYQLRLLEADRARLELERQERERLALEAERRREAFRDREGECDREERRKKEEERRRDEEERERARSGGARAVTPFQPGHPPGSGLTR